MILKNTELECLLSNCLKANLLDNNRISAVRFTDKQYELYKKQDFVSGPLFTSGIAFDFIYDGKDISFDLSPVLKASRRGYSIDLYADDEFVYTHTGFVGGDEVKKFTYSFSEAKERRIRIFFPYNCRIEVWNFTLDDGSTFKPTPTEGRKKILLLGDSITHGYDSSFTSTSYASMIITHYDAVALNQAVGGYFFCADMLDEELDFNPDAIIVSYGTNDWTRYGLDEERYRKESKAYIDKLCRMYPNAKIFGILPLWRVEIDRRKDTHIPFEKVHEILTEYYSAHDNVTIINGLVAVPNDVHFYTDGIHPNTEGQVLYGTHVICEMEKAGFKK